MIGILGGGQLGRMLALAGYPLDQRFRVLDPTPDAPAGQLAEQIVAPYSDHAALEKFIAGVTVVTYEFENVPVDTTRYLAERVPVYPPPRALEVSQERLAEKNFFQQLNIPTPPFAAVDSRVELDEAVRQIGLPAVLKTRRLGYDGKGQWALRAPTDIENAWQAANGAPLILEGFVEFERELSLLAVRNGAGEVAFYPLVENHHHAGLLRLSRAPAPNIAPALQATAEDYARRVLQALDYVGVLAIELFLVSGALLANEMAPRVHNSGHWTIEGAETSQFENHLRAILNWPLGSTACRGSAAMINLIGDLPDLTPILKMSGAHVHLYSKAPRAGRKLGHITLTAPSAELLEARLTPLIQLVNGERIV